MWMKLQRSCPNCGGVPCLFKEYDSIPFIQGDYYLEAKYWVVCNCGMTSHFHKDAYDAIDEFYGYEVSRSSYAEMD